MDYHKKKDFKRITTFPPANRKEYNINDFEILDEIGKGAFA